MKVLRRLRQHFMLTCEDINRFLAAYVEGTLDENMRERFEKHIAGCEPCRRYLEQYRATIGLVKEAEARPEDPPDELTEKTLAFLRTHYGRGAKGERGSGERPDAIQRRFPHSR